MVNLRQKKCVIEKISICNLSFVQGRESDEAISQVYEDIDTLVSIELKNTNVGDFKSQKLLGIIITNHNQVQEIHIEQALNNVNAGKSLADGLMRAKRLESITVKNCPSTGASINKILYNLAFSPKIRFIDVSQNAPSNLTEFVDNISGVLSISGSIEHMIVNNVYNLYYSLTLDFFKALGENSTLKTLSFNNIRASGNANSAKWFGKAIAINANKKGSLVNLYLKGLFVGNDFKTFLDNVFTSKKTEETWYGDATKAEKMGGADTEKIFPNKIEVLDLSDCVTYNFCFNYEKYEKKIDYIMGPHRRLFTVFKNLKHLSLKRNNLNRGFYDFVKAIFLIGVNERNVRGDEPKNVTCKLETLNLSYNRMTKVEAKILKEFLCKIDSLEVLSLNNNKLGVSGAYAINTALKELNNIKIVDLFANLIDVDGARDLAKVLVSNKSIEYLEIGYNRIRDEGLRAISEALKENPDCKI